MGRTLDVGVLGTGKNLGFTDGSNKGGTFQGNTTGLQIATGGFNANIGGRYSGVHLTSDVYVGIVSDSKTSGLKGSLNDAELFNAIIKY